MTKLSRGSSLLQARDSLSHSHSHSFFHRFQHNSLHAHNPEQQSSGDDAANDNGSENHFGANVELDSSKRALAKRDSSQITEQVVVNAVGDGQDSLVTHVRQTISLIQYVDPWGLPYETKTVYSPPNTVVVDPKSGETVAISSHPQSTVALPGSTPGGSGHASSLDPTISSPLGPTLTSTASATAKPVYPSVADIRNSTNSVIHSNSSFITPCNSSSIYNLISSSATISTDSSTSSKAKSTSTSTRSTHLTWSSSSSPSSSFSVSTLSSSSVTSTTAPGNGFGTVTVPGSLPTIQPETDSSSGVNLTPQQKQVIGGVVGAVAGVAVVGLLLMLFLRWKKKKGSPTMLDNQPGGAASRTLGDGTSDGGGPGGAMAESSTAASGAVAAALASLTGKRAPQTSHSADSGERGFYRISGRKLPSVLHNGGDGYSDPRGSGTSGSSDYYRGSQAFEPTCSGGRQLALGEPMRPVSGIPIIRSGPARIPITQNPFADSSPSPNNLSTRTLGCRESPRASGSRFQEKI